MTQFLYQVNGIKGNQREGRMVENNRLKKHTDQMQMILLEAGTKQLIKDIFRQLRK